MHNTEIRPSLLKKLKKLSKKDKALYEAALSKIDEVLNSDIDHYKNLRYDLKEYKRVHIGHFVLIFSYDAKTDTVCFEDLEHHDNVYLH